MPLTPVQRAEALLTDAVFMLYAVYWDTDFPESYISSVRGKLRQHLYRLRNFDDPLYHQSAKPEALAPLSEPAHVPAGTARPPDGEQDYARLLAVADERLREAVGALFEFGESFAEHYVETSAENHMAASLRWLRERETPDEQATRMAEIQRRDALWGERADELRARP